MCRERVHINILIIRKKEAGDGGVHWQLILKAAF